MKALFFKNIKRFVSAVALLALASCANITSNPEDSKSSASGEKIAVTFDFSSKSRTALPTVNLSEYKYKIQYKLHADSDYTTSSAFTGNSGISLSLTAGTYDFIVNAYDSSDTSFATPILTGSVDEKAISSSSKSVSVTLNAATGGTGTVKITLQVADNLSVSTIKAGLYDSISDDASTSTAQEIDSTTTSGYKTVTYTNSAVPSGVSKYVIFFLYDSSSNLIMPYVESVYVHPNGTSSSRHTINTEKFLATVTVQKNGMDWTDSWFTIEFVNAADSTDKTTVAPTSTSAIYTANLDNDKTYKVYAEGKDTELTVSKNSPDATYNLITNTYFPNLYEEEAYADTYLEIEFDSVPTINRASSGTVKIYEYVFDEETDSESWNLIDTIKPAAEKLYGYGVGGNSSYGEINAQYQLIQVIGNKVRIIPHHGSTYKTATLLENETGYSVVVDDGLITGTKDGKAFTGVALEEWEFITGETPSVSNNTLTVGKGKQFVTVQGALNYLMKNSSSGDWTINIDTDTYYERLFYRGSANITMSGQGSADYGTDVEIQWANQDGGTKDASGNEVKSTLWNTGSRGRNVFYFAGGNLVLENLSIINTATRKSNEYGEYDSSVTSDNALGSNQAEALLFDSTGNCAAYNCNFTSKQDTVYLSPSGGKAWFYGCKISGDVDFIWGLSDVALFERCNIISAYDSDKSSTYVVASHLPNSSAPYGKGFVLYNSTITTESGQTTYLARSPWGSEGNVAQVAIIDTAVTGGLASSPWFGNHVGGSNETVLGWKWYGVTSDGSAIADTYKISQSQYEAEFAGRNNIINRTYDGSAFSKAASTWDVNTLASTRNWNVVADNSKATLDGETETTTIIYDFRKLSGYEAWASFTSMSPTTGTADNITLSGFRYHGTQYGANTGSANATITIPVRGACTVTVYNSYTNQDTAVSLSANDSTVDSGTAKAQDSCELSYTGTSATNLVLTIATAGTYISHIEVTYLGTGGNGSTGTPDTAEAKTYNFVGLSFSDFPENSLFSRSTEKNSSGAYDYYSTTAYSGVETFIGTGTWTVSDATVYSGNYGNMKVYTNGTDASLSLQYNGESANFSPTVSSLTISNLSRYVSVPNSGNGTITVEYEVVKSSSASGDTGVLALLDQNGNVLKVVSGLAVKNGSSSTTTSIDVTSSTTQVYVAFSRNGADGGSLRVTKIVFTPSSTGASTVSSVTITGSSSVTVGNSIELTAVPDETPSGAYTWTVTNGTGSVTYDTSTTNTLALTGESAGSVTVTVSVDGVTSEAYPVTVNPVDNSKKIKLTDTPTGFAGSGYTTSSYYTGSNVVSIDASSGTTNELITQLKNAASAGNTVIYIKGMIDMTYNSTYGGSMLPTAWNDDNAALGAFITAKYNSTTMTGVASAYTSWSAWRKAYAAHCTLTGNDSDFDSSSAKVDTDIDRYQYELYNAWKNQIRITLASNTTIIGLTDDSGIKGGNIYISGCSNIMIRNLHLKDAFDPFPHHETSGSSTIKSDGWNAEYDCITIQDTNDHIWIDHCTFEDSVSVGWKNFAGVKTGDSTADVIAYPCNDSGTATTTDYEMWQTYDGLCDIKGKTTYVTVSYCVFKNHDKTMLLGADDNEKIGSTVLDDTAKTITLSHNYFDSCVQRLPFVRTAHIHIYNNYFGYTNNGYDQKASIQIRAKAWVLSEYNYFGTGISYRYKGDSATDSKGYTSNTKLYDASTNAGVSSTSYTYWTAVTSAPFTLPYTPEYTATDSLESTLKSNAGAGAWTVEQ